MAVAQYRPRGLHVAGHALFRAIVGFGLATLAAKVHDLARADCARHLLAAELEHQPREERWRGMALNRPAAEPASGAARPAVPAMAAA